MGKKGKGPAPVFTVDDVDALHAAALAERSMTTRGRPEVREANAGFFDDLARRIERALAPTSASVPSPTPAKNAELSALVDKWVREDSPTPEEVADEKWKHVWLHNDDSRDRSPEGEMSERRWLVAVCLVGGSGWTIYEGNAAETRAVFDRWSCSQLAQHVIRAEVKGEHNPPVPDRVPVSALKDAPWEPQSKPKTTTRSSR